MRKKQEKNIPKQEKQDIQKLLEDAYRQGYLKGYANGKNFQKKAADAFLQRVSGIVPKQDDET